ncbi:MAG: CPBP family intramembrane glutamic endopeptidase [Candidatus Nanopelagicales bacterium]|nr:CPBP family intramembrane metalloprotease [Candidatus Nanopelagicales bacterium]MDZ4250246.1 CPBP family intramembrane glutamic endopeptidase [Candidatus Nanopelagicales bacterium]MDZ7576640.1 CPBP family intramembrane glutamic endopeptidase [Candidatus Nanopelagicales bacterium]
MTASPTPVDMSPARLRLEVLVVMWVSLGATAVRAALVFIERLTSGVPLDEQRASIIAPYTPDRPWLDLAFQVAGILLPLGVVVLVAYLLRSSGESMESIGVDASQPRRDLGRGALLAAAIGLSGLALYLAAFRFGASVQIAAVTLEGNWWDIPVLLLAAAENALLEEIVVLGYVIHRLMQSGVSARWAVVISAVVRAFYHLYQGIGGFVGNLVMGLLFGWLFLRWRRATPMIVAHFLIDAVAFVGYAVLADRVDWLP